MQLPRGYDDWRLRGPDDDMLKIGEHEGETCNRFDDDGPDEDVPRRYRPRPCDGTMTAVDGEIECSECGAVA